MPEYEYPTDEYGNIIYDNDNGNSDMQYDYDNGYDGSDDYNYDSGDSYDWNSDDGYQY